MRKGQKMPEEIRLKLIGNTRGSKNKGRKFNKETIEKMSLSKIGKPSPRKGIKLSKKVKQSISKTKTGVKQSKESREKNRQAQYKRFSKVIDNYIPGTSLDRRKRLIKSSGTFHSLGEWENLKAQYNWTCPCCKKYEPQIKLTKDHIIPISRGGSNNIENIQPLCRPCNSRKNIKTIRY